MKIRFAIAAALAAGLALAAQAEESTAPKLAYGLLMQQGDKLVFAPCRDRSYAIVEDVSADRGVTKALKGIGLEAGKKLYVELFAVVEGINLKVSGLNFARAEGRCQQPGGKDEAWQATGKGWALAAGGEQVLLKRLGKPDVAAPYAPLTTEGAASTYASGPLALRFERAVCRDPATDVLFGWTATLTAKGEVLKGCAWQR